MFKTLCIKVFPKVLLLIFTGLSLNLHVHGQEKKTTKIKILHANSFEVDETKGPQAKRLIGDVKFKHEDAIMYCDSAYYYDEENSLDAYGNVKIEQGDSLQLTGDTLYYDGNTKKSRVRGNIQLINKSTILNTSFLDFDRKKDIAYYYNGGEMINKDENNTLSSKKGYYYPSSKSFFFTDSVRLNHPDYRMESDTLQYRSEAKILVFLGPTDIYTDDSHVYCESGWYSTLTDESQYEKNAVLTTEGRKITGDTIYFEKKTGKGVITCNVEILDTAENIMMKGDLAHFFRENDSAMVTRQAELIQTYEEDSLFIHADTFKIQTDTAIADSLPPQRIMYGYHKVKFFKRDMQGKCDSLVYSLKDSVIHLFRDPVIWSEENQLTADSMHINTKEDRIHSIYMKDNALIISRHDSLRYNQIKGDTMRGIFTDNELHKVNVNGNGESIYYAKDSDEKYIGVNKAKSSRMVISLKDKEVNIISLYKAPSAILHPIDKVTEKDMYLDGFEWRGTERPGKRSDIFFWKKKGSS